MANRKTTRSTPQVNRSRKNPVLIPAHTAQRAVYLDFEGNQKRPPSFAGVLVDDRFEQWVLEPALQKIVDVYVAQRHACPRGYTPPGSVKSGQSPRLRASTPTEFVRKLLQLCEEEDRVIAAWSSYEPDAVTMMAPSEKPRIERLVIDAKAAARVWKRRFHRDRLLPKLPFVPRHRLKAYLPLIGYRVPLHLGDRKAAARITFVREQLARRGGYERLTPTAKGKWTKVLDYNWHDCFGLRELALPVARDFATDGDNRR